MYGGNGVQLLPRFQDNKFQALLNEHQNTIEDPIQEKTEMPGKIHPFNIYILKYLSNNVMQQSRRLLLSH